MMSMVFTLLRVAAGVVIMKTGADLIQGDYRLIGFSSHEPLVTGIFLILIGIQIILSSILHR
ncbi:MAG: hypothetical protein ACWGOX_00720 [Desulforhopalus sp.]